MINAQHADLKVRPSYFAAVLNEKAYIRILAVQLVAAQVEAHLDMISDGGTKEYKSFKEVADCIHDAKETVKDYIEDLLHDFRATLLEEIEQISITTKAVILKPDDDIDADVDVKTI